MSSDNALKAAPPDDGGGQGSFTVPQDDLQVAANDREKGSPPLHYVPPRDLDEMSGRRADIFLFTAMSVFVIVELLIFGYAGR